MKRIFALIFTFSLLFGIGRDDIKPTMQEGINEAISILKDSKDSKEKANKIFDIFDKLIDYKLMSQLSLSDYFNSLTSQQQGEFIKAFELQLKDSFIKKLEIYKNESMNVSSIEFPNDKRAILKTIIVGDKNYEINFKFYPHSKDDWLIYDIDILGVSLISSYRSQFKSLSGSVSFDDIIKRLKATDLNSK